MPIVRMGQITLRKGMLASFVAATSLVALTGWGQREDRRRTHEAGFDYHLVKPADMSTLQSILSLREVEEARNVVKH